LAHRFNPALIGTAAIGRPDFLCPLAIPTEIRPRHGYLAAIAVFCSAVKAALALSRDLGLSCKSAFVLLHKLREAMAEETRCRRRR
jgi:hypothetical protein